MLRTGMGRVLDHVTRDNDVTSDGKKMDRMSTTMAMEPDGDDDGDDDDEEEEEEEE